MTETITPKQPLPPGWDELGAELVDTISRHYGRLRDDLAQMRTLVEDAIGKLVSAYHILQAQAKVGQEAMRVARGDEDDEPEDAENCPDAIGRAGTSAALTALQFEDVLTQLLDRLRTRCDRFRPLPTTLVEGVLRSTREDTPETERDAELERLRAELAELRAQVDGVREQDISQKSMDAGSVELF